MSPTTRREFLRRAAGGLGALAFTGSRALPGLAEAIATAGRKKPNFVFFLVDDLGWRDVGCYGTKYYETPHIDRLASQGMRFTDAYAACPVCSPTRASILTGKYPARLHVTDWIPGDNHPNVKLRNPDWTKYLPLEEVTIAEALKPAGYATASIGKWHLGGEPYYPDKQGFDLNVGGTTRSNTPRYFSPYGIPTLADGPKGEYLTDRLTDEAEKFIEANRDRPFFLYLSHFAVHTPIQGKKDIAEKYAAKPPDGGQKNAAYAAMIESVDQSVGRVMKKLDALRLADRTVIFFMSDNGGWARVTSNAPLRASKGWLYEGGVREPMIVRAPGVTRPGSACAEPLISTDFYPTMLELAGLPLRHDQHVDGTSFVSLLKGEKMTRGPIYWHYPHYGNQGFAPAGAVRDGDWKLIEYFEDGRVELYNLRDDLGEQKDLAAAMPEKARELQKMLADWRRSVGAQMPTPNPNYKPAKP